MLLHCVRLTEPPPIQQHQQQKWQQHQSWIFHVRMTPGGRGRGTATNGADITTLTPARGLLSVQTGRGRCKLVHPGQPSLYSLRRRREIPQWIEWRGNLLYWRDYFWPTGIIALEWQEWGKNLESCSYFPTFLSYAADFLILIVIGELQTLHQQWPCKVR